MSFRWKIKDMKSAYNCQLIKVMCIASVKVISGGGGGGPLCRAVYCIKSISIIKSIPVSVSERQINNTFNDSFLSYINKHKLFWPQSEQLF